jgi:protein SCO1/2
MFRRGASGAALRHAASLVVLLAGALTFAADAPGRVLESSPPRAIPGFTLVDQDGRPFRSETLRDRATLVFFGFTECPDVCPTTLLRLRNLVRSSPDFRDVRVLMISVDGERDSPAVLKRYLARSGPGFIGLTGTPSQVRPVARGFSAMFVRQPAGADGRYTVDHSSQVYLLDRSGRLRATFFNAATEDMAAALRAAVK